VAASATMLGLDPDAVTEALRSARPTDAGAPAADSSAGRTVPVVGGDSTGRDTGTQGGAPGAARRNGAPSGASGAAAGRNGGARRNGASARTGVVFLITADGGYEPRMVRLGVSDYDYSEVVSGLQEGDKVASLAMAALQAAREARNARFSQMGGVPGLQRQSTTPAGSGGAGGGGGRGNF